jgi:hypothetical protein
MNKSPVGLNARARTDPRTVPVAFRPSSPSPSDCNKIKSVILVRRTLHRTIYTQFYKRPRCVGSDVLTLVIMKSSIFWDIKTMAVLNANNRRMCVITMAVLNANIRRMCVITMAVLNPALGGCV